MSKRAKSESMTNKKLTLSECLKKDMARAIARMKDEHTNTDFLAFGDFDSKTIHKLLDAYNHYAIWKKQQEQEKKDVKFIKDPLRELTKEQRKLWTKMTRLYTYSVYFSLPFDRKTDPGRLILVRARSIAEAQKNVEALNSQIRVTNVRSG